MSIAAQAPKKRYALKAFLYALITAAVIFLPFVIYDKGYFFFFGDFNVQQIPFYKLAHEAVKSGDFFWNWYTDLGANFIGSYSFYLLGSPFFWLTLPFPTEFLPHLMAPLLILKHSCASLTGYLYIQRFVKNKDYAVLGGLLYAFSGFAVYNIFFNHFHEVIVFFPLLLIGMEELVVNNRRGVFAVTVAINAMINYWFFIGEVVFVLLYFVIRCGAPDWKMTVKRFFWVAFEAVLGMLLAMLLFLPSVLAILGNPRTGAGELLTGWGFWVYWHNQLLPAIVSSMFFPPDLPSRPNLFPDRGAKWASLSAWLPMVSMSGVLAYVSSKKTWLRKILIVSLVCALIPGLNSMFILFNNSYYARWYYMPILLMAMASVLALENRSIPIFKGLKWTGVYTALIICILALTPTSLPANGNSLELGLTKYPERFAAISVIALMGLVITYMLVKRYQGTKVFVRVTAIMLCCVSAFYSIVFIAMGKSHSDDPEFIRNIALQGRYHLNLPNETFARSDVYKSMDNLGMYWHLPNIQAFHSIVPVSIMEFYPEVGVKRDVSSKPETKFPQLRSLLSVRWLFVPDKEENTAAPMPGYRLYAKELGYQIYENENFIPMGFTYDYYISRSQLDSLEEEKRSSVMLRALVLEEEASLEHSDILEEMPADYYSDLGTQDFYQDAQNRRNTAGYSFVIDNRGFTSKINLSRENLVFYSVPYDDGWTAFINGQPAQIEKVNIGFMAVRAPAGENTIRFEYHTPGLLPGALISCAGLLLLIVYLLLWKKFGQAPIPVPEQTCLSDPEETKCLDLPGGQAQTQDRFDSIRSSEGEQNCPSDGEEPKEE